MNRDTRKELFARLTNSQAWALLLTYIFLMAALAVGLHHIVDRESLRHFVDDAGPLGPIAFFVVEYLYIILVPVYNTTIHLAAGYIFGGHIGWLLNFAATTAGLFTIVALVKKYGRPILQRVVPARVYHRYDAWSTKIGPMALFLVYVLPLFPDDEITYLIAAGQVGFGRFILPVLLGNVTKAAVSYIGDKGAEGFPIAIGSRILILSVGLIVIGVQEYMLASRNRQRRSTIGDSR